MGDNKRSKCSDQESQKEPKRKCCHGSAVRVRRPSNPAAQETSGAGYPIAASRGRFRGRDENMRPL